MNRSFCGSFGVVLCSIFCSCEKIRINCYHSPSSGQQTPYQGDPIRVDFFVPRGWDFCSRHQVLTIQINQIRLVLNDPSCPNKPVSSFVEEREYLKTDFLKVGWNRVAILVDGSNVSVTDVDGHHWRRQQVTIPTRDNSRTSWTHARDDVVKVYGLHVYLGCNGDLRLYSVEGSEVLPIPLNVLDRGSEVDNEALVFYANPKECNSTKKRTPCFRAGITRDSKFNVLCKQSSDSRSLNNDCKFDSHLRILRTERTYKFALSECYDHATHAEKNCSLINLSSFPFYVGIKPRVGNTNFTSSFSLPPKQDNESDTCACVSSKWAVVALSLALVLLLAGLVAFAARQRRRKIADEIFLVLHHFQKKRQQKKQAAPMEQRGSIGGELVAEYIYENPVDVTTETRKDAVSDI